MADYQVMARNFSEASENRIHSDDIAKKFGFKGALVPGVAVYGHLVYPLVEKYGADWLSTCVNEVRLIKPAYDGDELRISLNPSGDGVETVSCHNSDGELLATITNQTAPELPEIPLGDETGTQFKAPGRVEISWDTVVPTESFAPWRVKFGVDDNRQYSEHVADMSDIYREYVHPHYLLSLANTALVNEYVMPTWIHVGSQTRHRSALKVGDEIDIRSIVTEKWQKKGHEFIRLHTMFWRDEILTTDILHTAIFKVAA